MLLCYGTFASVLNSCRIQGYSQKALNGVLLMSATCIDYDNWSADDTLASHYFKCNRNLSSSICDDARLANKNTVVTRVETYVIPNINPNKYASVVLAIKAMIAADTSISNDAIVDMVDSTTKSGLLTQKELSFSRFLAGILLYAILVPQNRSGQGCVNAVNKDFVASFNGNTAEITFVQKTRVRIDVTPIMKMALLSEVGKFCVNCGTRLVYRKGEQIIDCCEVIFLADTTLDNGIDSAIAVCPICARELQNISSEKSVELMAGRMQAKKIASVFDSLESYPLEQEIANVLGIVASGKMEPASVNQRIDPLVLEGKVSDVLLRIKIKSYVDALYYPIENTLAHFAQEKKVNTDKFGRQVQWQYEDASKKISSQASIFEVLVDSLFAKTGSRYHTACEAVISYFVQRCEVFDALP